jgi:hypothetical protein
MEGRGGEGRGGEELLMQVGPQASHQLNPALRKTIFLNNGNTSKIEEIIHTEV